MSNLEAIAQFFLRKLVPHPACNSITPNTSQALLFPYFLKSVQRCIDRYKAVHAGQSITFTETYRSNALQLKRYKNGASKIKADGMHHFRVDNIFVIGGKRTYKGDITKLRSIFQSEGLTTLGMWDPLHVQFFAAGEQAQVRQSVGATLLDFQKNQGQPQGGGVDAATIAKARQAYGT